jgi:hypothetical protein
MQHFCLWSVFLGAEIGLLHSVLERGTKILALAAFLHPSRRAAPNDVGVVRSSD